MVGREESNGITVHREVCRCGKLGGITAAKHLLQGRTLPITNVGQWAWEEGRVWVGQWSSASVPQCKLEIETSYRKENQKLHRFIKDS